MPCRGLRSAATEPVCVANSTRNAKANSSKTLAGTRAPERAAPAPVTTVCAAAFHAGHPPLQ